MAKLTENFNTNEFDCNNGMKVPDHLFKNRKELAQNLQVLRIYLGVPIKINSAYRTELYNQKIGGARKSQHLECKASDIRTDYHTPKEIHAKIEELIEQGKMKQGGLGLYNSFVHYDIRGTKARWDFSK